MLSAIDQDRDTSIPLEPADLNHEREARAYAEASQALCESWGETCCICREVRCVCDEPADSDRPTIPCRQVSV